MPGSRKPLEIQVVVPVEDMARLGEVLPLDAQPGGPVLGGEMRTSIWPAIHPRILELIRAHHSTIVFTNSRRLAERLAQRLNELAGEELVRAHHGSIAREQRLEIEEELKAGRLPALVATSSLELGIDMGAVDLVIQVESPTSVARGLQRIGRAGHHVGEPSKGVIFPKYRGDLLETAVVVRGMRDGRIEPTVLPRNPLDVLAQQLVAMTIGERFTVDELLAIVRRAAPFETLTREVLEGVLGMLSGAYPSDEFAELKPRVTWDRLTDVVEGRSDARVVAVTSGGTIPDRGLYPVFLEGEAGTPGRRVGELDEEMVYELRAGMHGDVVVLGASSWRVADITANRVTVTPAPGVPGKLPFWHGDAVGRPVELGRAIGEFVRGVETDLAKGTEGAGAGRRAPAAATTTSTTSPPTTSSPTSRTSGRPPGPSRPTAGSSSSGSATSWATGGSSCSRRSAAACTHRGRSRSRRGSRSVSVSRSRRSTPTTASRSGCPRATRASTAWRSSCSRIPTRSRTWSWGVSAGRACSRAGSARTRRAPCSCPGGGRGRGPRSGSSASGRRTCSRSRAGMAPSRSWWRPTGSAWPTSSTCRPCARSWAACSGGSWPSTRWRRRERPRSRAACCSTTSPPTCTRATPPWPSAGPRR